MREKKNLFFCLFSLNFSADSKEDEKRAYISRSLFFVRSRDLCIQAHQQHTQKKKKREKMMTENSSRIDGAKSSYFDNSGRCACAMTSKIYQNRANHTHTTHTPAHPLIHTPNECERRQRNPTFPDEMSFVCRFKVPKEQK